MKFAVLGALEVTTEACSLRLGGFKQRIALAVLLARPNQSVSNDQLVEALWGERPPRTASDNLRIYIHQLRRLLGEDRIERRGGGYALIVGADELDALQFVALAEHGRALLAAGESHAASDILRHGLELWRGPAFAGLDDVEMLRGERARLEEHRLTAIEARIDADLSLARSATVVPELVQLVAEHPLRERLHAQLMFALYHTGRQADALAVYRDVRKALADELGVDPGPELSRLHQAMLTGEVSDDFALLSEATELAPAPINRWSMPALLPTDTPDFTGRDAQISRICALITQGARPRKQRATLCVTGIAGMGGIGKTALAVHVAHRLAGSYPDGQLYVNLRGAEANALDPADVLARFLRSSGVDSRAVPQDVAERAGLYRSRLAGRRVLIVLDNAASEEQIRPLLPGAASCAVLMTSRSRLTGVEGARWIDLDVFESDQAIELLARIAGDRRVAMQPADAAEIVRLCGYLPLAVRVAGARLTARPTWPLAHLRELLSDQRRRLDRLATGDLEVRASLGLSYHGLNSESQRLCRLLGMFDAPDFPFWMAAAVIEGSLDKAVAHLETLVDAQLLNIAGTDSAGQSRYRFHDLVRLYARERAELEDSAVDRESALARGLGSWLAAAEQMAVGVPGPCFAAIHGSAPRPPIDWAATGVLRADPLVWFDSERAALLSGVRQACALGLDELAFDLAGCLEKYFDIRGMYVDWRTTNEQVMWACQAAGNLRGEAVMLRGLIDVLTWNTTHDGEAMSNLHTDAVRLLAMFAELSDERGMADAAVMCSWGLAAQGAHAQALDTAVEALRLAERSDHQGGQARAHVALALAYREHHQIDTAVRHLVTALDLSRKLGNVRYEATVLQFLGIGHLEAGDLDACRRCLDDSLVISRRYRDNYVEALTMLALARLYLASGDQRAATAAATSLALGREYNMTHHVADALGILGEIELAEGHLAQAIAYLEESVRLWRTRGWPSFLGSALHCLGNAYSSTDPPAARVAWTEARTLFEMLGDTARVDEITRLLTAG